MATKFLEPGGDADFAIAGTNGFWPNQFGSATVATDFVHGGHIKSIKYVVNSTSYVGTGATIGLTNTGNRISIYIYINAMPTSTTSLFGIYANNTVIASVKVTSAGTLQLWNGTVAQIGSNGSTLSTGVWYRLCFAYTITSTTINELRLYKDGISDISVTNGTIGTTSPNVLRVGNINADATLDLRSSDHYVDDSSSLTDTGNIWVTAKRPFSNGTTNNFTTQVGSGGSGYGSGHSPQVNERPLSTTNGWSMVGAGSAVTEEYTIEGKSVGDIDISTATIVDYVGWVSAKSLAGETASIVVGGVSSNISLTSTNTLFTKVAGSATYPAGGTDIGIVTDTSLTTVTLNEAGIIVAYIPSTAVATSPSIESDLIIFN